MEALPLTRCPTLFFKGCLFAGAGERPPGAGGASRARLLALGGQGGRLALAASCFGELHPPTRRPSGHSQIAGHADAGAARAHQRDRILFELTVVTPCRLTALVHTVCFAFRTAQSAKSKKDYFAGTETFTSDGKFVLKGAFTVLKDKESLEYEGTWNVKDGFLIETVTKSSRPTPCPCRRGGSIYSGVEAGSASAMLADDLDDGGAWLPALWQRAVAEERAHPARCATRPVCGVQKDVYPHAQGAAPRPEVQGSGARRLPGPDEPARHPPHLRGFATGR